MPQIEEMVETLSSVNSILSQLQNNLTSPSKLQRSEKKELWMQLKNQVRGNYERKNEKAQLYLIFRSSSKQLSQFIVYVMKFW